MKDKRERMNTDWGKLTHICLKTFPSLSIGQVCFSFKGCLVYFFHFYHIFDRNSCEQTVYTLTRQRIMRRLIWVCTVCLCPKHETPGLYGLILCNFSGVKLQSNVAWNFRGFTVYTVQVMGKSALIWLKRVNRNKSSCCSFYINQLMN